MNLDLLADIPEDGRSVLFVAEDHNMPVLEEMLELLHAYGPDAIGIEMRPTADAYDEVDFARSLALTFPRESPLRPEHLYGKVRTPTATTIAVLYAAWRRIPIYFLDWQPVSPGCIPDASTLPDGFPCEELGSALRETLEVLFDLDIDLSGVDLDRRMLNALLESDHGLALRNEYTAQAVDAKQERKLLYVGGNEHFCDNIDLEQYAPLQELVAVEHRYLARLTALDCTGDILERVTGNRRLRLPWERVAYMEGAG